VNRLQRSLMAIRFLEWWYSKLAMAATVALSLTLATGTDFVTAAKTILLGLIPIAALGAFGYGINDVADAEVDRRRNKPRPSPLAEMSATRALLVLAPLVPVGIGAALVLEPWAAAIEAAGFILAAAYSLEPLRLKERGLAGVLTGACAERVVPTAVYLTLFPSDGGWMWALLAGGLLIWSGLVGMRWMAIHQIFDATGDRRAGLRTWGARLGERSLQRIVDWVVFPGEAAAFGVVAATLIVSSPWVALGLIPAIPGWFLLSARRHREGLRYETLPLADVYNRWWPLAVLGALIIEDVRFAAVAGGHLLLFRSWWLWKRRPPIAALRRGLARRGSESVKA
jgi:4-hydroxybenzoate polyprenyltransferase